MGVCVVIVGDLSSGYRVVGPFKTYEHAVDWDDTVNDRSGYIMQLEMPEPAVEASANA